MRARCIAAAFAIAFSPKANILVAFISIGCRPPGCTASVSGHASSCPRLPRHRGSGGTGASAPLRWTREPVLPPLR